MSRSCVRVVRSLWLAVALLAGLSFGSPGFAADPLLRYAKAVTRVSLSDMAAGKHDRIEFASDEFKGWVRRDGELYVESRVVHSGLLCGEYQVGLRLGAGSPGCANVKWLSEVVYATRRNQCNNAQMDHAGGATDAALTAIFDQITCAERVIRCTGNCR